MSNEHAQGKTLRTQIMSNPSSVLDDRDVMRALIAADEDGRGDKVVDLRSIALERLEARFERLEDTHRTVIAAAYDNLASTNQIHRAVLHVLEPNSFAAFLTLLEQDLAEILGVDTARLCLESPSVTGASVPDLEREFGTGVAFFAPGEAVAYCANAGSSTIKPVIMRGVQAPSARLFGEMAEFIQSEAVLRLDLGPGNLPALLVLGSRSESHFTPHKAADLLMFFASVFERVLQRWLG